MYEPGFGGSSGSEYGGVTEMIRDLQTLLDGIADPRDAFVEVGRALEETFGIHRGLLAVREGRAARFLAVATWQNGRERRNLSLRLPLENTLFAAVIDQGQIYTQSFAALYDGSVLERRLLIDDDTQSFMLRPLKHDGEVIALLGFSSRHADAFVLFEEGVFDSVFKRLAALAATHQFSNSTRK